MQAWDTLTLPQIPVLLQYNRECRTNGSSLKPNAIVQSMSTSVNRMLVQIIVRRVWRYQKCHQKPEIKEEQTIQIYNDKKKKNKRTKNDLQNTTQKT